MSLAKALGPATSLQENIDGGWREAGAGAPRLYSQQNPDQKSSGSNSPGFSADKGTGKRKGWRGEITVLKGLKDTASF